MSLSRCIVLIYCCTALWISVWIWNVLLLCLQTVSVTMRGLSAKGRVCTRKVSMTQIQLLLSTKKREVCHAEWFYSSLRSRIFLNHLKEQLPYYLQATKFQGTCNVGAAQENSFLCCVFFFFFWALNSFVNPDFDTQMVGALYAEVWWPWWKALKSYLMVKDTLAAFILSRA